MVHKRKCSPNGYRSKHYDSYTFSFANLLCPLEKNAVEFQEYNIKIKFAVQYMSGKNNNTAYRDWIGIIFIILLKARQKYKLVIKVCCFILVF